MAESEEKEEERSKREEKGGPSVSYLGIHNRKRKGKKGAREREEKQEMGTLEKDGWILFSLLPGSIYLPFNFWEKREMDDNFEERKRDVFFTAIDQERRCPPPGRPIIKSNVSQ